MNTLTRERSLNILCLVAPVAAVVLTPIVTQGPRTAMAAGVSVPFAPLPVIPERAEPVVLTTLPREISSPFPIIEFDVLEDPIAQRSGDSRTFDPADAFVLTSVMPSVKRPLAVINGRPCRPGQLLGSGWSVSGIDSTGRSVTIEHVSGRTRTLRLRDDRP